MHCLEWVGDLSEWLAFRPPTVYMHKVGLYKEQESRAAARKPRDAASVLFR